MNIKLVAILLVVIVVVAGVVIYELPNIFSTNQNKTINIGLVAPMSTVVGQDMQRAAAMAVAEINAAGGIYVANWHANATVVLTVYDTINDAPGTTMMTNVQKAASDNVDILIGGYGSAGTLADEVVAIDNKIPFIITGASNQLVTRRGPQGNYGGLAVGDSNRITDAEGMSYIFHYCTTTYQYSKTVVDFFNNVMRPELGISRNLSLALVYRNDAFGQGVKQATEYWIQQEGLNITLVVEKAISTSATTYQTDLTDVASYHPDAVFVADNPDRTPTIIKQGINDVGLHTVYIAVENNEDPVFYSGLGSVGNGQLLQSQFGPFVTPSYSSAVSQYNASYTQKYSSVPGMMGVNTYDAVYITKAAIEAAGTVTKSSVRAAIENLNMNDMSTLTATGKIVFSTGTDYHEIAPVTFVEQMVWNTTTNTLNPVIVWSTKVPDTLKQADFVRPSGYVIGS